MKITTFKNMKGLIHGTDSKRIGCDKAGTLKISTVEISISAGVETIMPVLFNGCTGIYGSKFTDKYGAEYDLGNVTVKGGRIELPPQSAVEFMELRCRIEELETLYEKVQEQIRELSNIFDTNSLNFLIK